MSIRKWRPSPGARPPAEPIETDPAGLHANRQSLQELIEYAFEINNYQIAKGSPNWTYIEFFNLDATTSAPATNEQLRMMLRRALAERFGLRLSTATKQTPALALVIAPGGPKLKPLAPGQFPAPAGPHPPGMMALRAKSTHLLVQLLDGGGVGRVFGGRTFVDHTGLTGLYNIAFYLSYTTTSFRGGPAFKPDWDAMPAALKKLGLELKPETDPIEFYTIISAHPPTAN